MLVGEGPDKQMLTNLITELGLEARASLQPSLQLCARGLQLHPRPHAYADTYIVGQAHVSLCDFTKEPFYVFERCDC